MPTSNDAPSEPRTAPAPMAAVRMPTPGSPVPSSSMATTTVRTISAPRVRDCAAARPMMRARSRLRRTTRIPSSGRAQQVGLSRCRWPRRCVVVKPQQQGRCPERGTRCHSEHDGHAGELQQQRRQQRTHQRRGGVQQATDHVGAGELVSGVAERREQGGVRRSVERGSDGRQHRQRIHDLRRSADGHDDRGRTGGDTTQHGDQDQHALPAAPVGQRRQQRAPGSRTGPCEAVPPARQLSHHRPGKPRSRARR